MSAGLDWSRATVLSLPEFEVSWELLALGETPMQLDPPYVGGTFEQRREVVAAVGRELYRRGLGDGVGPHPVLAEQLRLLADPDLTLDVRLRTEDLVAGIASCRGRDCVLAVRHGSEIAMLRLPADAAAPALVELIGQVRPGPGAPVTVPADVLEAAAAAAPQDPERFADELVRRGVPRADAGLLVRMCSGVRRWGQFGATAKSASGWRRRAPYVVGTHHSAEGSFRQLRRRGSVSIAPLSSSELLDDLHRLAAAARNRRS